MDEIIIPEVAATLHQRALELSALAVWVVSEGEPGHPGVLVARLITAGATPYVLTAPSLPEMRAKLPPGLKHSERQPGDPEDIVELAAGAWLLIMPAPRPIPPGPIPPTVLASTRQWR